MQFTIHDGTDGIGVYSSAPAALVMEGDQVRLIGSIGQFNGLTQMYPDSIAFISSNNTLTPTVVTQLGENTESELVTLQVQHLLILSVDRFRFWFQRRYYERNRYDCQCVSIMM